MHHPLPAYQRGKTKRLRLPDHFGLRHGGHALQAHGFPDITVDGTRIGQARPYRFGHISVTVGKECALELARTHPRLRHLRLSHQPAGI